MRKFSTIALVVFGMFACSGMFLLSTYNTLVVDEEGISSQEKLIDLAIDKMVKKIEGQGHVVANFRETLLEVMGTTIGQGGRAASAGTVFNAVRERYPEVPKELWRDLAATMSAEYESVAAAQTSKVARVQAIRIRLRNPLFFPARLVGGFPTINVEEAGKVIVGTKARESRASGSLETVDPFTKK